GLGTAIGELPPYFMARSARLSGVVDEEDEELSEFEEMVSSVESKGQHFKTMDAKEKLEYLLHQLIQKAGFFGILLCASIPNPLFDLAGMTCGHFLVPFWHFFGATFIGKALIKVHIQQIVIIAVSSEHYINALLAFLGKIPYIGKSLNKPLLNYIAAQKEKLHKKHVETNTGWIPFFISSFVALLMLGFVISIIHAFAKDYHRRLCKWRHKADGEIKVD
ncbi:Vacuolar membrane protease, partial [Cichlidogyrus casuarinus]